MAIITYRVAGKEYIYVGYFDALRGKQVRVFCGLKDDPEALRRAQELEEELKRTAPLKEKFREEATKLSQLVEDRSDVDIITNAKTALALRKALVFLFDARYLVKNFPGKFEVKQSELEEHSEIIKRLLEKYDPQFDLKREEADEEKYLHWQLREHIPPFAQISKWMYKNWFAKMENLVGLVETLPPGDVRDEVAHALLAVSKVARGFGLDTDKLEYRLSELLTP